MGATDRKLKAIPAGNLKYRRKKARESSYIRAIGGKKSRKGPYDKSGPGKKRKSYAA